MLGDWWPYDRDPDRRYSVTGHTYPSSGSLRQIEASSFLMRPAIVDSDLDGTPVSEIGHGHASAYRKVPGRGGERIGIETFTARGLVALLLGSVPRGCDNPGFGLRNWGGRRRRCDSDWRRWRRRQLHRLRSTSGCDHTKRECGASPHRPQHRAPILSQIFSSRSARCGQYNYREQDRQAQNQRHCQQRTQATIPMRTHMSKCSDLSAAPEGLLISAQSL
jgi:hypothetical protein